MGLEKGLLRVIGRLRADEGKGERSREEKIRNRDSSMRAAWKGQGPRDDNYNCCIEQKADRKAARSYLVNNDYISSTRYLRNPKYFPRPDYATCESMRRLPDSLQFQLYAKRRFQLDALNKALGFGTRKNTYIRNLTTWTPSQGSKKAGSLEELVSNYRGMKRSLYDKRKSANSSQTYAKQ